MANYTTIFELIGAFARVQRQFKQFASEDAEITQGAAKFRSLDNLASRFVTLMNDSATERRMLRVISRLRSLGTTVDAGWQGAKSVLDELLTTIVAGELSIGGSTRAVLDALARAMDADSQSIQENVVSAGSITADTNNAGTGKCYASILTPSFGDTTHDSQLVRAQGIEILCESDSANDGLEAGKETWRVRGVEGLAGNATTIPVTAGADEDARNLVIDGSYSLYSGGSFTHFTETGAAIFSQEITDTLFDNAALKINGTGAATLSQTLSDRTTPPRGGVLSALGIHAKVTSITAGTVTVRISIDGSPLANTIVFDNSTPTGSWAHYQTFAYLTRAAYPKEIKVEVVADASFNGNLLLDGLSLAEADNVGHGLSLAIFRGVEPFTRLPVADRFSLSTTSDDAGVFSVFLRDIYGVELPVSGTPTISDSLAI